jgi:hypothetical protein
MPIFPGRFVPRHLHVKMADSSRSLVRLVHHGSLIRANLPLCNCLWLFVMPLADVKRVDSDHVQALGQTVAVIVCRMNVDKHITVSNCLRASFPSYVFISFCGLQQMPSTATVCVA